MVEEIREHNLEAQLSSIDFRPGEKWRVRTALGSRQATIEDDDFLRQLDHGLALHKNDLFDVTVREVATTRNGRTTREWVLIRVKRKRRGGTMSMTQLRWRSYTAARARLIADHWPS